ncbi:MAG: VWA domain-containing protein [Alphaproteobacteria bacterium]|nr:VWA domain-containing protein [Alphaproteobacteria bacterium]
MFTDFFLKLRDAKVPVTLKEHLTLIEGLQAGICDWSVESFYYLARTSLVKDEAHLDKFDRVFGEVFKGIEGLSPEALLEAIPEEWLKKLGERFLTEEEKRQIQALGGWEKLMETLRERLAEQKGRHQGGSKWIGTAGTSPFGAYGYNPEGIRIGQDRNRNNRAVKVWDKREFRNFDDKVELGTRNIKVALRKLRRFAREGAASELDLPDTIRSTAHNAGWLDVKMVPERHNAVKVLLFMDVGGSMDEHIKACEELFSAAKSEFKHLEFFYFHNCPYEAMWKDNRRRWSEKTPTLRILRTYGPDYKAVFVGDATMSPYEIVQPGGSVEHFNDEAGQVWLHRITEHFRRSIWLNPVEEGRWNWTQSIGLIERLIGRRMFPLTLDGLDRGIRALSR